MVKDHFVALRRVQGRTGQATLVLLGTRCSSWPLPTSACSPTASSALRLAWVAVLMLEALVLTVPLVVAARPGLRNRPRAWLRSRTAAPASDVVAFSGVPEDATEPGRWRRLLGRVGPGPTCCS